VIYGAACLISAVVAVRRQVSTPLEGIVGVIALLWGLWVAQAVYRRVRVPQILTAILPRHLRTLAYIRRMGDEVAQCRGGAGDMRPVDRCWLDEGAAVSRSEQTISALDVWSHQAGPR
jgi:hypothetical protein